MPYNVNQATEQDAWDGDFCSISLHGLLEHLPFNANSIKESLHYITKYICNKKIENGKFNEVTDLKGIGEIAWNFISAIYESGWDSLIADNNNTSFGSKVSSKFTLKINEVKTHKSKSGKNADKPATFNRLSPPIPAKLPKKVNKISKYFKKNNQTNEKKDQRKLYAQALTPLNNTREVLKKMFPNIQGKKN